MNEEINTSHKETERQYYVNQKSTGVACSLVFGIVAVVLMAIISYFMG